MTTLNILALHKAAEKIKERLSAIKDDAFSSTEFNEFKSYVGKRDGLQLALDILEEVEKELNG